MIYLLATMLTVVLSQDEDATACIMTDCLGVIANCMADLQGPDAETAGFQCLIDEKDATCNECLMDVVVASGGPACFPEDCGPDTLPCFVGADEVNGYDQQCFKDNGAGEDCNACVLSADSGNDDSGNGNNQGASTESESSEDPIEACFESDGDCFSAMTGSCAAAFGTGMEAGFACLIAGDDTVCQQCMKDALTKPDGPAPKCWNEDCDITTITCLAVDCEKSDKECEKDAIACMRLIDTSDACTTCLDDFEKKSKSAAAAFSIFAAVATTVLALL